MSDEHLINVQSKYRIRSSMKFSVHRCMPRERKFIEIDSEKRYINETELLPHY
jgi:hypothetical protein